MSVPLVYNPPPPRTVGGENTRRMDFPLITFQLELPKAQCYCPVHTAAKTVTGLMTDSGISGISVAG